MRFFRGRILNGTSPPQCCVNVYFDRVFYLGGGKKKKLKAFQQFLSLFSKTQIKHVQMLPDAVSREAHSAGAVANRAHKLVL